MACTIYFVFVSNFLCIKVPTKNILPWFSLTEETIQYRKSMYIYLVTPTFTTGYSLSVIFQIYLNFQFQKCFINYFFECACSTSSRRRSDCACAQRRNSTKQTEKQKYDLFSGFSFLIYETAHFKTTFSFIIQHLQFLFSLSLILSVSKYQHCRNILAVLQYWSYYYDRSFPSICFLFVSYSLCIKATTW